MYGLPSSAIAELGERVADIDERSALCEMSTPLGLPVVPEVYLVRARVEGEG